MDYIGSHQAINWLFILFLLSVFQWVLTVIYLFKYSDKLFYRIDVPQLEKYKHKVPFLQDYFYIYWNIYPIVFYLFFYYLDTSWFSYLNQILMIGGDMAQQEYDLFFKGIQIGSNINISYQWIDMIVLIIITFIAYSGTFGTQIKKQIQFIQSTDKVYWWDIRISKGIFWIRFIFLFINLILVGFTVYLLTKVTFFVIGILQLNDSLLINPFYPDNFGGLKVLMEIASIVLAVYLLRATMGLVGFLDHIGVKDKLQFWGDLYHTAYLLLGVGFIIFFIYKIDYILDGVEISQFFNHQEYTRLFIENTKGANRSNIQDYAGNLNNYYGNLIHFNKFPIDLNLFINSIFTFVLPLSLWFVFGFFKDRKQEMKNPYLNELDNSPQ